MTQSARFALVVILLLLGTTLPAFAATDTVTSLADDGSAGTLRAVIAAAAPGDTIVFNVTGTITLVSGELLILKDLTISGPGAANLVISGNNVAEVFFVGSGSQMTATISGVTIENGYSTSGCGGIFVNGNATLTVNDSTLSGNSPGGYSEGGAVLNYGTLTVNNSTVSGNFANEGGGIYNQGALTVSNSTLSGNSANEGAGIYNRGTLTVSNSALSGNSATSDGGAIYNDDVLTVTNSTLSGNSAAGGGGGILNPYSNGFSSTPLTIKSTILSGNTGGNCLNYGSPTSDGYNLSDDNTCSSFLTATGDLNNTPAGLDPNGLQNNGGPTQTIALLPTSPAVDAIPLSACTDASGNPVATDQRGTTRPQGQACDIGAYELTQVPTANVCPAGQTTPAPCSYTITLQYNLPSGPTFGANPVKVVTQGAPNLDFTLANTTCSGSPSSCTVQVTFAPLAPGLRMGAVQLTDSSGNLFASSLISGIGQGPAIAFGAGNQSTVGSGLNHPYSAAVDAAGDVFIADEGNNRVVEVPSGGGAQTTVGSGFLSPQSVAVDGAGDILVADRGNTGEVVKVPAGCTTSACQTIVSSGLNAPLGVAADGAGDVFIAADLPCRSRGCQPVGFVYELPAGGGTQSAIYSGSNPSGVAVDGAGDVFVADYESDGVTQIPAGGGAQTTVGSWVFGPYGVAVDAAGDVFIADSTNTGQVPVGCTSAACQTLLGTGLAEPIGVAVDASGNVFIADFTNNQVVEVNRSVPPSFSFATTPVGSTSSDSPQSVAIQNMGNQPLNLSGLVVSGPNFVQVPGPGTIPDCNGSSALAPGASCNLSISFIPQSAGNLASTATLTDNALNGSSAMQSISLQGTATPVTVNVMVATSPAGLAFSVDGTNYSSAQSFTWTIGAQHTIATVSPQTPSSGVQTTFAGWSDGGALSHTVTATSGTTTYAASFNTSYLLTTAASPAVGGSVTPATGNYYAAGTVVNLTATPNAKYAFSSWSGSVANPSSASTTVTMSSPQAVTASFVSTLLATTTSVMSSLNPSSYGQSVTFTATITSGTGTPLGSVSFKNGKATLGTVKLVNGSAALSTSVLNAGSLAITAQYGGSPKYAASSSSLTQTVAKEATTTLVVSSGSPSTQGSPVTFTATVTASVGTPTGNVVFKDGTTLLATVALSGGTAQLTTSALTAGTHTIHTNYLSKGNYAGSSGQVKQVVK